MKDITEVKGCTFIELDDWEQCWKYSHPGVMDKGDESSQDRS